MTVLASPRAVEMAVPTSASAWTRALPGAVVVGAVAYLTMPFAEDTGGRGHLALTKAAIAVCAALIAAKPWRSLSNGVLAIAAAVGIVALIVCLVTPPGWFGATRAAAYGLAAGAFVAVAAYARTVRKARLIALVVVAAGVAQFFWAFIPWHGGEDSSLPMLGTFYWHDQFAAFLLAPALIGGVLVVEHRAPWRSAGWVVVPLAVAGIVHSTSRGGLLVFVGGWLLLGVMALRLRTGRRQAFTRWVAVGIVAAGVSLAISGPPFFTKNVSPVAAAQARAVAGGSADANAHFRLYVWRESVSVFEHHPLVGVGYGGFAPATVGITPASWPHSPLSHNDYLQPLVEGGLLLGVPFLAACALIGVRLVKVATRRTRRRRLGVRAGLALAGLALMAHAAVDFDWTFPALMVFAAVTCGAAIAAALPRPVLASSAWTRIALVVVLLGTIAFGAVAGRAGGLRLGYVSNTGSVATAVVPGTAGQ